MKKTIVLQRFLLLIILFSSCNQAPFYHRESQNIEYSYSAIELMSDFPSDSLTILINLNDIHLLEDILVKVKTDQPGLDAFEPKLNDMCLSNVRLWIDQPEEDVMEEIEEKLENIEMIMRSASGAEERILADYRQRDAEGNSLHLNNTSQSYEEKNAFISESSSVEVAYYLRLTFSERPELEFLNVVPNIYFSYEVIFAEEE